MNMVHCDTDNPDEMCIGCYNGSTCFRFHWKRRSAPIFHDYECSTLTDWKPRYGGTWRTDRDNILYWAYRHTTPATRARARVTRTREGDA